MTTRRQFLGALGLPAVGFAAVPRPESSSLRALLSELAATPGTASAIAMDEAMTSIVKSLRKAGVAMDETFGEDGLRSFIKYATRSSRPK